MGMIGFVVAFKYVLIDCKNQDQSFTIVRGYAWAEYHDDIYQDVHAKLKQSGKITESECVGGGRIQHDASSKHLKVYGYSQAYGRADHAKSVELLRAR
ncbi:hypothetical protein GUITHDRAFT_104780 [Guillardia theta CCMP2712]|uniref:14 kDa phosphohistidine phosphatase n=1 Tax=Guillardia theta (strain CCMP2712) TaxID=905079 RepID=L1JLL9_GUITC|nr:hypothetical protein GUITHDRAFT_104780 [Guillardia theta CCMP2712]EKX49252.1 hypothetical protein GUITHDRAFT_104780 [Guillardia theta CCMP2712]|eukprot:XP_005836232.1 hypothetical protein GUITHDRAFT_104780 [Guillardia theta CCMP2712]